MDCPYCQKGIHTSLHSTPVGNDKKHNWTVLAQQCPACGRLILILQGKTCDATKEPNVVRTVQPKAASVPPPPPEVTDSAILEDFNEACLVLSDSPKASAALSRRCLQTVLRLKAGVEHGRLVDEINEAIKKDNLPSYLANTLHQVRDIGNFAAHPDKDKVTGAILPVEPKEAEWNLKVLRLLFDFYYTQPKRAEEVQNMINGKKAATK